MATPLNFFSLISKTLTPKSSNPTSKPSSFITSNLPFMNSRSVQPIIFTRAIPNSNKIKAVPGLDYNHWFIVMDFPDDPTPTREQMIEAYLDTLATVLGSMEEAKKNMYAFSTTRYTAFQCTVSKETSEKFQGLPGVHMILPDSYSDAKNFKDYGGDKYVNGEIIPFQYPTFPPKAKKQSKYESKKHVRQSRKDQSKRRLLPNESPST